MLAVLSALIALFSGVGLNLDPSSVIAVHSFEHMPVACVQVDSAQLREREPSLSLPQNLSLLPSVVAVSENGTGVGYSSFSVRGISGYHTNVTLNGITLGDSESQEVFWVNIPGLSSILSTVQLQRGLGTASCGPGAFGASLNMLTSSPAAGGVTAGAGYGSFGTVTASARAWTGTMKKGFFADGAFNLQRSGGYLRNSPATVWSAFANAGWRGEKDMIQIVALQGWQKSAITWNGVPFDVYPVDRTFNVSEGDTDNFRQTHLQLNYLHGFSDALKWNTVLNYTRGYGWYEIDGGKDFLGNNLYVLRSELSYSRGMMNVIGVAYLSRFVGDHWGRDAADVPTYSDRARKSEADISLRAEWGIPSGVTLFGEVQYRGVLYDLYSLRHVWNFCNPRLGVNWSPSTAHKLYAFFASGHREPARADFDANPDVRRERLFDFELGYRFSSYVFSGSVNLYDMEYRDMLLETGTLDSQGYSIKDNVPSAHRRGVEAVMAVNPLKWLRAEANCTFSDNRHSGGHLLLSPSVIASASAIFSPWDGFSARCDVKYVGRQYYSMDGGVVPRYLVCNLSAGKSFPAGPVTVRIAAYLNNVLNRQYYAYAHSGGVFPAAPRNGSIRLTLEF